MNEQPAFVLDHSGSLGGLLRSQHFVLKQHKQSEWRPPAWSTARELCHKTKIARDISGLVGRNSVAKQNT
jgi:hypothetical protein